MVTRKTDMMNRTYAEVAFCEGCEEMLRAQCDDCGKRYCNFCTMHNDDEYWMCEECRCRYFDETDEDCNEID